MSRLLIAGLVVLTALLHSFPQVAFGKEEALAAKYARRGQALYEEKRYEEAAAEFKKAFESHEDPSLLYQIALCYIGTHETQKAIASLHGYLRRLPNAPNRNEVESRISELQSQVDKVDAVEKPTTTTTAKLPPLADPIELVHAQELPKRPLVRRERSANARALILSGLGLTTVGLVLGGVGIGALVRSDAEAAAFNHITVFDGTLASRSSMHKNLGIGLVTPGVALLAGGVAMQIIGALRF